VDSFATYIIHNPSLPERRETLAKALDNSMEVKFIEIENCAPEFLEILYKGLNPEKWVQKSRNLWYPIPVPRQLTKGEVAATASHFYSYMDFLSTSKKDWIVVLEDDAVFESGLPNKIENLLDDCPARVDALFIGGGYQHELVSLTVGIYKSFIIKHHPATNTTVGYALKRRMISRIMESFESFDHAIDFELAYLLMINNALVFHSDPYLICEGSKSIYKSSLR
jgi:GR25 family glycosyltransferase involved in LPS biosynthesis